MKRILSIMLSAAIFTSTLTAININYVSGAASELTSVSGWTEALYASWSNDSNAASAKVYYKPSNSESYKQADSQLVRQEGNGGRVDIPGLKAGEYDIRIITNDGTSLARKQITVNPIDRSGYAHFNYSGVGAYNDDGTPKNNAQIVYVTNDTKNSVELNGYKGLGNILKNANKSSNPIIIRVLGKIDTQSRDSDGSKKTDQNNGVVALNGLTDKAMSDDSYFNMMDVAGAKNLTIEGIGTNAVIEKWGFTWSNCEAIEVKNLNFTKYPEDACSTSKGQRIWIHNNTFDIGENKYDLTTEQDKHEGDGSTDIIQSEYVTLSYNRYNKCHKTALHGGGDSIKQYNITWHHNYFNNVSSRMPLVRHANVHSYNNYFYKGGKCIDSRASAWVFSEANYFENCTNAHLTTKSSSEGNPVIKSYRDVLVSSGKSDKAGTIFTAASREETYDVSANKESYHNFDTNPNQFYYDASNNVSNVAYLTSAEQAKQDCIDNGGVLKANTTISGVDDDTNVDISTETTTETTTQETTEPTTSSLIPLDEKTYNNTDLLTDTSRFVVFDTQNANLVKINENGYVEFNLDKKANVTISYKCGSGNSTKSAACILNGEQSPMVAGGSSATQAFVVKNVSAGVHQITAVVNGTTTVQISSITIEYLNDDTTESTTITTTETTTVPTTESTTESTTVSEYYSYGDADVSGVLTANDAALILKRVLDPTFDTPLHSLTPNALTYLDVDNDETLSANDAACVITRILNGEYDFPCLKDK